MSEIGAFEAKTHFSKLLDRVARGEEFTITLRGRPVAKLVAVGTPDRKVQAAEAVAGLKALRAQTFLGGLDWKALRDEGRR